MRFIPIIFLLFFIGCVSPSRLMDGRNDKLARPVSLSYFSRHKEQAAQFCFTQFPPENIFIPGDSVILLDTAYALDSVYVIGDSVTLFRTKIVQKKVTIRDTVIRTDTRPYEYWQGIYRVANDSLQSVKGQLYEKKVQLSTKNKLIRTLFIVLAIELVLLAVYIGYKIRKPI